MSLTVTDNEQQILEVMRKERDEWAETHDHLVQQVAWARKHHMSKLADSLRYARDHADTMRAAASDMYDNVYAIVHPN